MINSFRRDDIQKLNENFRHKINSYGNINNSLIIKLEDYMRKEMNTTSSFNQKTWKFIKDLKTIRNNIAHNNGRIYDDQHPKRVVKAMESLGLLPHPSDETLDEKIAREIEITREFIPNMVSQVESFLLLLLEETNKVNLV